MRSRAELLLLAGSRSQSPMAEKPVTRSVGLGGLSPSRRALPGAVPWRHVRLLLVPDSLLCGVVVRVVLHLDRQETSSAALTDKSAAIHKLSTHAEPLASSSFQLERFQDTRSVLFRSWNAVQLMSGGREVERHINGHVLARPQGEGVIYVMAVATSTPTPTVASSAICLSLRWIRLAKLRQRGERGAYPCTK